MKRMYACMLLLIPFISIADSHSTYTQKEDSEDSLTLSESNDEERLFDLKKCLRKKNKEQFKKKLMDLARENRLITDVFLNKSELWADNVDYKLLNRVEGVVVEADSPILYVRYIPDRPEVLGSELILILSIENGVLSITKK